MMQGYDTIHRQFVTHGEKFMIYDVIIIGTGAAGLFAGASVSKYNRKIKGLFLEKTKRPGTKLLMSGGGMCNITHAGSIKDFVPCYGAEGKKIRSSLFKYNNEEMMSFIDGLGVPLITREDGKVFPKSLDAKDVLNALIGAASNSGFEFKYESEVTSIIEGEVGTVTVSCGRYKYLCKKLIISTGGASYPTTGSDGSINKVLKADLGLEIATLKPALSPVNVYDYPYAEFSGISFKDAEMSLWNGDKKVMSDVSDLLLTHQNFSGPVIINNSRYAESGYLLKINYVQPLDRHEVLKLITEKTKGSKADLSTVIAKEFSLPKAFAKALCERAEGKPKFLSILLTEDTFTVKSAGGFNTAMATAGGIALSELDLKTMKLKKHPSIYAIGECIDIVGKTGGYNLQFAYSSANSAIADIIK